MNNQPKLDKYKQEIADLYTRRSQNYDNSDWHLQIAQRLVNLLEQAGFKEIEIKIEQDGSYISLEKAKAMWAGNSHPAPGQYPPPLSTLSTEQLAQAQAEFEAELETLQTEQGIWNDITTFYVFGQK